MFGNKKLKAEIQRLREQLDKAEEKIKALTEQVENFRRANGRLINQVEDEKKKSAQVKMMLRAETTSKQVDASSPSPITFGQWDASIHTTPEQKTRQDRALDIYPCNVDLNKAYKTATIRGQYGIYNVTLEHCDCEDFYRRHLPCKHIYRLAMELGMFPGIVDVDRLSVDEVMEIINVLSWDEQQTFGYTCFECGKNNRNGASKIDAGLADYLVKAGLVRYAEDLTPTFNVTKKENLLELFGDRFDLNAKMKKSEIVDKLKDNVTIEDFPMEYRRPLILLSPRIANDAIKIQRRIAKDFSY